MTSEEEYLESVREDNDKAAETQATNEHKKRKQSNKRAWHSTICSKSLEQYSSKHLIHDCHAFLTWKNNVGKCLPANSDQK